jgi:hypothetical protein
MDYDDLDVDNIAKNADKPKKIKSGAKGKSAERELVHLLNERFDSLLTKNSNFGKFSRSVGSGNRWGQHVDLPKHAKDTFSGDLCVPQNFKWVIESKKGYNDIDLISIFSGKCPGLDEFLDQVTADSKRCGRKPMLIWKKDRKPRIAFIKAADFSDFRDFKNYLVYNEWVGVPFDDLLSLKTDNFFFSE